MKELASTIRTRYAETFSERYHRYTTAFAGVFFALSIVITVMVSNYAARVASNPVTDIILSNTRVYDVDGIVVYGAFALIAVITLLVLTHPKRAPFILYSLGLLFLIRAFFIPLTHLGLYPVHTAINFESRIALVMFGGGDDFFSGHVGGPFLMALLFWEDRPLRWLFLIVSVFFALVVLLGHMHYTIDVAAAFFITYAIYHLAQKLFSREYALFRRN